MTPRPHRHLGQLVSAGVGLAASAIGDWMSSIQLSHDADTATTLIVNGLAQQLSSLDAAYLAAPATCETQRAALNAYDEAWQWLQSPAACGNPSYGSAGNRCISDRAPGGPTPWATYYRDPIANDPRLSGQCDTALEVLMPCSTSTNGSGYCSTGITADGGNSETGALPGAAASAAAPPASSPSATTTAAPVATTATMSTTTTAASATESSVSPVVLYAGLAALLAVGVFWK